MQSRSVPVARGMTIIIWLLRIVVAGLFLAAAFFKLSGQPMMVAEFETIGLGQWFRVVTGLIELVGGLATLVPAVSVVGTAMLLMVTLGAFVAQLAFLHGDVIHVIVIAALLVALLGLQRDRLRALLDRTGG